MVLSILIDTIAILGSKHDGKGKPLSKEITDALDLYADDRTGKTDFALESAGISCKYRKM